MENYLENLKHYAKKYKDVITKMDEIDLYERLEELTWGEVPKYYILRQFFAEYNIVEEKENLYIQFYNLLKKTYPDLKDYNITEIGGGVIPQLGKILAKDSNSTITVYDKKITKNNDGYENLILKQKIFDENTDIKGSNLLVGLTPCEATEQIIKNACKNNIEYAIALCFCEIDKYYGNVFFYLEHLYDVTYKFSKGSDLSEMQVADNDVVPVTIFTKKKSYK